MKRITAILILAAAISIVSSCSASYRAARAQEERELAGQIAKAVDESDLTIMITEIRPLVGPARSSNYEYKISIRGNHIKTRLPFFGKSNMAMAPGDDISIVFDDDVDLMRDMSRASRGEYNYMFRMRKNSEIWDVSITVYENGIARITCNSNCRDVMNYDGEVTFNPKFLDKK